MRSFPSKSEVLTWIRENPDAAGKREIARAFGIRGAERVELKRLLRELEEEGHVLRNRRRLRHAGHLPKVAVVVAEAPDADGDIFARPVDWSGDGPPPDILYVPRRADPAIGAGDRFLARLSPVGGLRDGERPSYEARLIKRLDARPRTLLGIFRRTEQGGRIVPVDKKAAREWLVPRGSEGGAREGELVEAEALGRPRLGLPQGRVVRRLGDPGAARQVSLIALHEHGIPLEFPADVLAEAERAQPVAAPYGEDLTHLPLVTIDPADARDHDDAVAAMPDDDPANPGGWVVWVAIADVAAFVRPGSALDREARLRGNSTYFPDRVAPMLPERLSGDLCSLHEGVERPVIAVRMVIDAEGRKRGHRFTRGLMRSRASLTYEQVQAAIDGRPDAITGALLAGAIEPLYGAWRALAAARERRQPLDLDLPERRIELDEAGNVAAITTPPRLDAHRLIEDFMVLANVAAAETLEAKRSPLLYRVHEQPTTEKIDALRDIVESIGLSLPKAQVLTTRQLNQLLRRARETEVADLLQMAVLRAQTQAYYAPENLGHFGLHLRRYAHFTSPIRRYADLVVHRALIRALGLGAGGLAPEEIAALAETAEHISTTERRSMAAERDTVDRYVAAYLADRRGAEFDGRISGVTRFGLFVKLDETGADGLVPVSTLGREYFRFDEAHQALRGRESGTVFGLGQRVRVRLVEAAPVTGGLLLELVSAESAPQRSGRRSAGASPRERSSGRKPKRGVVARAKAARRARR